MAKAEELFWQLFGKPTSSGDEAEQGVGEIGISLPFPYLFESAPLRRCATSFPLPRSRATVLRLPRSGGVVPCC